MILHSPFWLILLLPLIVIFWRVSLSRLRWLCLLLVVLALSHPALRLPTTQGRVVLVADRSESMPAQRDARILEALDIVQKSARQGDAVSLVTFGQTAQLEAHDVRGTKNSFFHEVGKDHSNLHDALSLAGSLVDGRGRILLLSDGKWTGADPLDTARVLGSQSLAVDYRLLERPSTNDMAIVSLDYPREVLPGDYFMMRSHIYSPIDQEIDYALWRNNVIISKGKRQVATGKSSLSFRDQALGGGVQSYRLTIAASRSGQLKDAILQNNEAKFHVGVNGAKPLLLVGAENSSLATLLIAAKIRVVQRENIQGWGIEDFSRFSGIILNNYPARKLGRATMAHLSAWVEGVGGGLMITGGMNAYGPGGYYKSPLEDILPVSMELRQEHRKFSLAVVVVLDRSGSMAAPIGHGGRKKMDLANLGTAEVGRLLSPGDCLGVIAVDSTPHTVLNLNDVKQDDGSEDKILGIQSMGGGIFVYTGLRAAAAMLAPVKAGVRHIILFADAADAEEPGDYKVLLERLLQSGITVSVIGLGTPSDVDADFLRDVAARGGGRIFFSDSALDLPALFAQDTFSVTRSAFVEEPTALAWAPGMRMLSHRTFASPPSVGGYNLCYTKPGATVALSTTDELTAPLLSFWQAGRGRVLAFMGEAEGRYAGDFAKWGEIGAFYSSMARWTGAKQQNLPEEVFVGRTMKKGELAIQLYLDPARKRDPFLKQPELLLVRGTKEQVPTQEHLLFQWKDADTLEAKLTLRGNETVIPSVRIDKGMSALAPVCLPYSPEFAPSNFHGPKTKLGGDYGAQALQKIASVTGGIERLELSTIWNDMPTGLRFYSLRDLCAYLALILLLLDILFRRTGTQFGERSVKMSLIQRNKQPSGHTTSQRRKSVVTSEVDNELPSEVSPPEPNADDPFVEALRRAKERE